MIEVGSFVIMGDWDKTVTPKGKLRIVMPPLGHLDGAGWSPFTQAGILGLTKHLRPGMSFAEIGAGSGILCVAARLLGAKHIVATELDRDALAIIPQVFAANNITEDYEIIDGTFPNSHVDLALCSISTVFGKENAVKINAKHILNVDNDGKLVTIK